MTKKRSILLVDVDCLFRNYIHNELLIRGFRNIRIARSSREAMHQAAKTKFDLILIDLFMSQLSGLQLAQSLQQQNTDTEIILLLNEKYQPVLNGEIDFPISLKTNLLAELLKDVDMHRGVV